jgi:hypothetical protein
LSDSTPRGSVGGDRLIVIAQSENEIEIERELKMDNPNSATQRFIERTKWQQNLFRYWKLDNTEHEQEEQEHDTAQDYDQDSMQNSIQDSN